jgi:hypothetical protein
VVHEHASSAGSPLRQPQSQETDGRLPGRWCARARRLESRDPGSTWVRRVQEGGGAVAVAAWEFPNLGLESQLPTVAKILPLTATRGNSLPLKSQESNYHFTLCLQAF